MEFLLVNTEICESRLYRTSGNFSKLTGRNIADLLYLNTLALYMLLQNKEQHDYAKFYAKQTTQYNGYKAFRTHATDLYMLCYVVKHPDKRNLSFKNHEESVDFLKKLNFDNRRHYAFLLKLAGAADGRGEAVSFYLGLEKQMKIKNSIYKRFRRSVSDWGNLKYPAKQEIIASLTQEIRKSASGAELMKPLMQMLKYRKYETDSQYKVPRHNFSRRPLGIVKEEENDKYKDIANINAYWSRKK